MWHELPTVQPPRTARFYLRYEYNMLNCTERTAPGGTGRTSPRAHSNPQLKVA